MHSVWLQHLVGQFLRVQNKLVNQSLEIEVADIPPSVRWCCQSWRTRTRARPPWREPSGTGEDGIAETQTVSGLAGPAINQGDSHKMSLICGLMKVISKKYRWLPPQDSFQELNLYAEPTAPNGSSKWTRRLLSRLPFNGKRDSVNFFQETKCNFLMISSQTCSPRCCRVSRIRDFPLPVVPLIWRNEYSLVSCQIWDVSKESVTNKSCSSAKMNIPPILLNVRWEIRF